MIGRALATWFALLLLAIANGAFRQGVLVPRLDAPLPHQISTVMLCVAILALAWFTIVWIGPATTADAWKFGALWLVLTLAFEFCLGRMASYKKPQAVAFVSSLPVNATGKVDKNVLRARFVTRAAASSG